MLALIPQIYIVINPSNLRAVWQGAVQWFGFSRNIGCVAQKLFTFLILKITFLDQRIQKNTWFNIWKQKRWRCPHCSNAGESSKNSYRCWKPRPAGFVFYLPRAGAARLTARTGAWLFWAVRRCSEFWEPGSLCLITGDRQSRSIQIVNNIRITVIPHRRTGLARRTSRTGTWRRAGAVHRTKSGNQDCH